MADSPKPSKPAPANTNNNDDWQKGVPYAQTTGTYTGPVNATKRESVVRVSPNGTATEITGGLQPAQTHPISADEFNQMAKGGAVKSWHRALDSDAQRRASRRATLPKAKPKGW